LISTGGFDEILSKALIAHLRARVFYNLYYPGAYWLLAIANLVLPSSNSEFRRFRSSSLTSEFP
jgi:hypothetical protein